MKITKQLSAILIAATMITLTSCQSEQTFSKVATLPDQSTDRAVVDATATAAPTTALTTEPTDVTSTSKPVGDLYKTALTYCVENDSFSQQKNVDERIYPASMTKLLTAYTALKYIKPETKFKVGSELDMVQPESSLCLIQKGNVLTLRDLLTGLIITSGNDAAYTIAVGTARSLRPNDKLNDKQAVEYFCGLMNKTAAELGMTDSRFANPDGWDNESQYTTTRDLLTLTKVALKNPTIKDIIAVKEKHVTFSAGGSVTWKNHIKLIDPTSPYYCKDFIGGKTGTTDNAGYCLISVFQKSGKTYIIIVTGCKDDNSRCAATLDLYSHIK